MYFTAIAIYDWFLTSSDEIRVVWSRKMTGAKVLFVLNRYLWIAMFVTGNRTLGAVALPFWWATVVAGLLILVRWLPARGRHSSGPVADAGPTSPARTRDAPGPLYV